MGRFSHKATGAQVVVTRYEPTSPSAVFHAPRPLSPRPTRTSDQTRQFSRIARPANCRSPCDPLRVRALSAPGSRKTLDFLFLDRDPIDVFPRQALGLCRGSRGCRLRHSRVSLSPASQARIGHAPRRPAMQCARRPSLILSASRTTDHRDAGSSACRRARMTFPPWWSTTFAVRRRGPNSSLSGVT